jgi:serpin B
LFRWITNVSGGRVKEVVTNVPLDSIAIVNSVHFKGEWKFPFDKADTAPGIFYTSYGEKKRCHFMRTIQEFEYFENEDFQAVNLPYEKRSTKKNQTKKKLK